MLRRSMIAGAAASMVAPMMGGTARAAVPHPYDWTAAPPLDSRQAFIDWMVANRGEDPATSASASTDTCNSSRITTSGTTATSAPS